MSRRRIFILSAIASLTIAGGSALLFGMHAWAGHGRGHQGHGGPFGLVCQGNSQTKLDNMNDKVTNWLDLNDAQQQNLKAVVQVVKDSNLKDLCPSADDAEQEAPAKLANLEQAMTLGLQTVQNIQEPFNTFYDSLSSEQQTKLNTALSRKHRHHKQQANLSNRGFRGR